MPEKQEQTMMVIRHHPQGPFVIGRCVHNFQGWHFVAAVAGYRETKVFSKECIDCIPEWARNAMDELLTLEEWRTRLG